jgi:GTPase SAR1 family protein
VPLYFRDAAAAVVVFDMTDRDSYNDARGWVDMVRNEAGPEVHVFLVGGKSDLKDSRTVLVDTVKQYAAEKSIAYVEASALSGENVAQLFMLIGKQVIESREVLERKAAENAKNSKLDDKEPTQGKGCRC